METLANLTDEERDSRKIKVEAAYVFRVPVARAFSYITALDNWKDYWPDFVRIQGLSTARWRRPGDTVTIVVKLLNRERELHLRLQTYDHDRLVTYLSRQKGLPDAFHQRRFRAVPGGFEYRLVVDYLPRPGTAGLFDRSLLRGAITRALNKTIRNLDTVFKQW